MRIFVLTSEDQTFARRLDVDEATATLADARMETGHYWADRAKEDLLTTESGSVFDVFSTVGDIELLIVLDIE